MALGVGGEVRAESDTEENKMASEATCRGIQRQIKEAKDEIAELTVRFDRLTQFIRECIADLQGLPDDIRPTGQINDSFGAMAQARRHLQNLPNPRRREVQEAIRKTHDVDTALSDTSEVSTLRIRWQGQLFGLQTLYAQDCRASA